ncbi:Rossmann-like and DUF2520 domain-containing protein [Fusibacter ferrireducens]|uniref:DUF2520 domain-containing protein n=1 Tax=Fusibacter ferrireducens TaxID=2785058 RepID=A0ABR9ZYD8_9FIRM|nr:Rossmann-like and DUF2520 domain-containing protein [Fusibacter ferrireducens]MBF4695391.1 DUF2520 domain-containing protein [Fusibacter ferrireducens]
MKFGFVGAGKVGQTFGRYLSQNGYPVVGYYSRTYAHAENAAIAVQGRAYDSLESLAQDSEMIVLTVTDQMIEGVSRALCHLKTQGQVRFVVHMSGALSARILERREGIQYASIHPMQSFAKVEEALAQMPNTVFGIEGDEQAVSVFEDIFRAVGNDIIKLTEAQKVNYHLAAVIVSNYLVTLMQFGLSQMAAIGIEESTGIKALLPLIRGTLANVETFGPEKALTGPIVRGDYQTVKAHLHAMDHEAEALYKHLGRETLKLALAQGMNTENVLALRHLLEEE